MASYQKLKAWEHARDLAIECFKIARTFPPEDQATLADQLRRAATSAALNIAEGASRSSYKDYRRFLDTARASLKEVAAVLVIAHGAESIDSTTFARLEARCEEASKTLYGLIRFVDKQIAAGEKTRAA